MTTPSPFPAAKSENAYYDENQLHRLKAYEPSIPQGWNAPKIIFPKEMYMPKELPAVCYKPPSNMFDQCNENGNAMPLNSIYKPENTNQLSSIKQPMANVGVITPSPLKKAVSFNLKKFVPFKMQAEEAPYSMWKATHNNESHNQHNPNLDNNCNTETNENNELLPNTELPYTDF